MTYKFKIVVLLVSSLLLSGCKRESYSHEYLLEHPTVLQKELARCQASSEPAADCDQVKEAGNEFVALVGVRSNNPDLFGQQVLHSQMDLAKAKAVRDQALQAYEKMKASQSSGAQLEDLQKKLTAANEAYETQAKKVRVLLAVVAATMSEGF